MEPRSSTAGARRSPSPGTITLTRVEGNTIYGSITETSDPPRLSGDVHLTLQEYDMALLVQSSSSLVLCSPDFWRLAPEWLVRTHPCG
jgi:hypothetical protein